MINSWDHIAAVMRDAGVKGMPHLITTNKTLTSLEDTKVTFRFAEAGRFFWTHGLYSSDLAAVMAGTDLIFGGALIEITNTAGKGALTNGELAPIGTLFGRDGVAGEGPRALVMPMWLEGQTEMTMRVQNKYAGAQTLYLTLLGVKVI